MTSNVGSCFERFKTTNDNGDRERERREGVRDFRPKSQLFLRKIFDIEHADYCCGFNFLKNFLETASRHNNRETRDAIMS